MKSKPPARAAGAGVALLVAVSAGVVVLAGVTAGASPGRDGVAQPFRVGLVVDAPGTSDPWGRMAEQGLRRAARRLGIQPKVLRASPREGYLPNLEYLARRRYDLVIGVGALQVLDIDAAAGRFPGTRFALIDEALAALPHHPSNVAGVIFASEQSSYLAGFLAGLVERRTRGRHSVGSVGFTKVSQVDRFIAGYQAGARRAAPRIATVNGYAEGFTASDRPKCRNVALDQIARGAGVIFNVAGRCGLGALQAAKERGRWGIGVDVDQSSLGRHILTSAIKRVDVAVFEMIRAARRGRLALGRTTVLGLRQGAVGLARISPRVPRALKSKVERVQRLIASGRIRGIPTELK